MKYVILKDDRHDMTRVHPLIFPEYMTHAVVALGYAAAFKSEEKHLLEIVGAGFCHYDDEGARWVVSRSGSESLKISPSSRGTDLGNLVLNMFEAQQGLLL